MITLVLPGLPSLPTTALEYPMRRGVIDIGTNSVKLLIAGLCNGDIFRDSKPVAKPVLAKDYRYGENFSPDPSGHRLTPCMSCLLWPSGTVVATYGL